MQKLRRYRKYILLAVLIAALFSAVTVANAQDGGDTPPDDGEVTDDDINAIAEKLYCPVCENVPLDVCETKACADWRDEIRTMLEEGRSEEEIRAYFSERYGQRVLANPGIKGLNIIVWVLPPLGLLVGAGVLVTTLRRMAPGALEASVESEEMMLDYGDLDPEYVTRLEREVKEFAEKH